MKILQYNGPWQFSIEEVPQPTPNPDEVLIRTESVGICGSDIHGFTGESGRRRPGMVMGHEAAGTVVETGNSVTTLKAGDRVAVFPTLGCGTCVYCRAGLQHICPDKRILGVNAGRWGAMADYFVCNASQAYRLEPGTDPAIGILAEPIGVAMHAVNRLRPEKGQRIAIVGAGTIGLSVSIVLQDLGVGPVHIAEPVAEKLALAKDFGAAALDPASGMRFAGVFEAVGAAATVRTAFELCDFGGTVVLIGNLAKEFTLPLQGVTSNETTLKGSYGFTQEDFAEAVRFVSRRRSDLERLITGSCSLEETPDVMAKLARGELKATKMVVRL